MKIFYCAKCKTLDSKFNLNRNEEKIRATWTNIRDYGGYIHHLVCPHCGYVLSGFICRYDDEISDELVDYIKTIIEMYSSKKVEGFIKASDMDFIAEDQMKKKINKYKDSNDKLVKNIINSMCMFD